MNTKQRPNRSRQIGFYILILVLLVGTIYSMTRTTAKTELVYSEVVDLFRGEKVESFSIDTDGNLTMKLREAYKGSTNIAYRVGTISIFYTDLNDLIQEQKAAGILTEYDYAPAWEAAWWLAFVPYLIIFLTLGGLGLLLGIFSLIIIVRKNLTAQTSTIQQYRAMGFSEKLIGRLLLRENLLIPFYAICIGAIGSVISISANVGGAGWGTLLLALLCFMAICVLLYCGVKQIIIQYINNQTNNKQSV